MEIYNLPTAPTATNQTVCWDDPNIPGTISVPDLTAIPIGTNTIKWYFDPSLTILLYTGQTFSTGQTTPGIYTYYVTQTDANGCESSATTVTLEIYNLPIANFSYQFQAGGGCGSGTVIFNGNIGSNGSTNGSGVIDTWIWDFGDPPGSPVTNTTNGNESYTYISPPNIYSVNLTVSDNYGCISLPQSYDITIANTIEANFIPPAPVCFGDDITFDATASTGSNTSGVVSYEYKWTINGSDYYTSSPLYTFNSNIFGTNGFHNVTLETIQTYSSGAPWYGQVCTSSEIQTIYIWDTPNADFTSSPPPILGSIYNPACEGDASNIQNNSSDGVDASITSYNWTYNNGTTLISFTPPFIFPNADIWNVQLTATDANGCSNTYNGTVLVVENPTVSINVSSNCFGNITNFNSSIIPNSYYGITNYQWTTSGTGSFGNAGSSSPNTSFFYSNIGPKQIDLTVTDANGCIGTSSSAFIEIWQNPTAIIQPILPVCENDITFFDGSLTSQGSSNTMNYQWDFGDLSGSSILNTSHIYVNGCNNFPVSLEVVDGNGCSDIAFATAVVNCLPTANFDWTGPNAPNACDGEITSFSDQSYVNNSNGSGHLIDGWLWNMGDPSVGSGPTFTTANPSHIFGAGNYDVSLTVWDDQSPSCSNSVNISVLVNENPNADFTSTSECLSDDCTQFTDISTSTGNVNSWNWTINPGDYCGNDDNTYENPRFLFNASGIHPVTLQITDDNFCTGIVTKNVEVYSNPTADFIYSSVLCQEEIVTFSDNSLPGSGNINEWCWNFGGPNIFPTSPITCPGLPIEEAYWSSNGTKTISLTVTDDNDCESSISGDIYINNLPTALFDYTNVCADQPVEFTNLSYGNDNPIVGVNWIFSDGFSSAASSPNHVYTSTVNATGVLEPIDPLIGAYVDAVLIVTDQANCTNSISATDIIPINDLIEIHPKPTVDFVSEDICIGECFSFEDTPGNGSFSSVNNSIFISDFIESSNSPGTPTWYYWDPFTSQGLNNTALPIWNTLCATGSGITTSGTKEISLTRETNFISELDGERCRSTITKNIEVLVSPRIMKYDTSYSVSPPCGENVEYSFDVTHNNHVDFWEYIVNDLSGPMTITNPNEDFTYNFALPGIYPLNIHLENNNGCYFDTIMNLHIYPSPVALFTPLDTAGCDSLEIQFKNKSDIPLESLYNNESFIENYIWSFGDGSSTSADINPIHNFYSGSLIPQTFLTELTVITNHGCVDKKIGEITVWPVPEAYILNTSNNNGIFNFLAGPAPLSDFWYYWTANGDTSGPNYPTSINVDSIILISNSNEYTHTYASSITSLNAKDTVCVVIEDKDYPCSASSCVIVDINYFNGLWVPNAIHPDNSDNGYTLFKPRGKSISKEDGKYSLMIFDKFGNLVFKTTEVDEEGSPKYGWDGTKNGIPLPQGMYIWKIHAEFSDGTIWPGTGIGFGEASNPEEDPWKKRNMKGLKSGTLYLIR